MVEETHNRSVIDSALEVWKRRKWLMIMAFLAVFVLAVSLITALPSLYTSSTTVLFGQEDIAESLVTSGGNEPIGQRLAVVQQEVMSRDQLLEVIEQFNLYPELREELPDQALVGRMRSDIIVEQHSTVESGRQGTVSLTIGYQTWDPELAARVATELAARYERESERLRMRSASRTTAFLKEELGEVRARMLEKQAEINEFKTDNLGGLPQQVTSNLSTLDRLNSELRLNGEKQLQLLSRLGDILSGSSQNGASSSISSQDDIDSLKRQLESLRNRYTESFPGIIRLQNRIAELEQNPQAKGEQKSSYALRIANNPQSIERELDKLSAEETEIEQRIEELQNRIEYTPKVEQELQQLTSEYNSIREEYLELEDRYQNASLAESLAAQQGMQFQVLEAAIPPFMPSQPQSMRLMVMGLVMALGVAGGFALLSEQMDKTFHSVRDLRAFTSVPILGTIAQIDTPAQAWRRRLRFLLIAVLFLAVLSMLAIAFQNYGEDAKQLVWMMAR